MHDLMHGLSDREHRRELLREAKMDRMAKKAREGAEERREPVRTEDDARRAPGRGREKKDERSPS